MIDVFIIHSGKDYDYVKEQVEPFLMDETEDASDPLSKKRNANVLTLESGTESNWKKDARKKIKLAQVVIIVIGEDASEKSKIETMGWEVDQAIKYNKQLMIVNRGNYSLPDYLYRPDRFTKQNQPIAEQRTLEEIKERIDDYARGYYDIFSPKYKNLSREEKYARKDELLEQYTMFQKTSEDLVARRQTVNSFYISVNSALAALVGVVVGLVDYPAKIYVVIFMCLVGVILDISWVRILDAYGTLNAAKMKVIRLLEEQLPVILYDTEWRVMSDKLNNKRYVSFTNSEKRIPYIFAALYILILIAVVGYLLVKTVS